MTVQLERVTLMQSSMQFSDGEPAQEHDAEQVFDDAVRLDVDVIGFTETSLRNRPYRFLKAEAEKRGWWFQGDVTGDCRFALNPKNKRISAGYHHVLDGKGGMPSGNFSNRGVVELAFETEMGNLVTDHLSHWLTGFRLGADGPSQREEMHDRQTKAMVDRVILNGVGGRVSFWQGDTNINEEKDTGFDPKAIEAQFSAAGLESIFDAVYGVGAELPATHPNGKTIDILGRWKKDKRVKPVTVKVLRRRRRKADHLIVVAEYNIITHVQNQPAPPVQPRPVEHACTACGLVHTGVVTAS